MHYHPDLAAALAEARVADLRDAAAHARRDSSGRDERRCSLLPPSTGSTHLDAYPRLCGLPVTIARLANDAETQTGDVDITASDSSAQRVRVRRALRSGKRARHRPTAPSGRRTDND